MAFYLSSLANLMWSPLNLKCVFFLEEKKRKIIKSHGIYMCVVYSTQSFILFVLLKFLYVLYATFFHLYRCCCCCWCPLTSRLTFKLDEKNTVLVEKTAFKTKFTWLSGGKTMTMKEMEVTERTMNKWTLAHHTQHTTHPCNKKILYALLIKNAEKNEENK